MLPNLCRLSLRQGTQNVQVGVFVTLQTLEAETQDFFAEVRNVLDKFQMEVVAVHDDVINGLPKESPGKAALNEYVQAILISIQRQRRCLRNRVPWCSMPPNIDAAQSCGNRSKSSGQRSRFGVPKMRRLVGIAVDLRLDAYEIVSRTHPTTRAHTRRRSRHMSRRDA